MTPDDELRQLINSNARAIEALTAGQASLRQTLENSIETSRQSQEEFRAEMNRILANAAEERSELRQAMLRLADMQNGVVRLLSQLDEERPTLRRQLNSIEMKVDRLLERTDDRT